MSKLAAMVREFHESFGLSMRFRPGFQPANERAMRVEILAEEFGEYLVAEETNDFVEVADALADMVYVIYGTALTYGIDLDAVITEVHESNMSKLDDRGEPIYREDGKVLKGPNFHPPNIEEVLWPSESSTAPDTGA